MSVLSGNQAVARGFYEAGGLVAAAYPGSPTVGVINALEAYDGIYQEFSINEKVALEVAIGASFAGARSLAVMKHVGINIAMDPLMSFTQTDLQGGFILMTGDDPGMSSSQNEQDSRILGKFANMPVMDPCDSQEILDFMKMGYDVSEEFKAPMLMRLTSRLCHARSNTLVGERVHRDISGWSGDINSFCMIPPTTIKKQYNMKERIEALSKSEALKKFNRYEPYEGSKNIVITSGLMYENFKELDLAMSVYKLGIVFPLNIDEIRNIVSNYENVIILEELTPFIENQLKVEGIACEGKSIFSFTGELHTETIKKSLIEANIISGDKKEDIHLFDTVSRPSMFCSGCPHRPVFDILKKSKKKIIGDIGCYSLAMLKPFEAQNSIISMGASIGIMKGMSKALSLADKKEPLVATIGDGTFYHSGMTGLMNLLHNMDDDFNMTLIILNNGLTAMTGGQMTASSGSYTKASDMDVDMLELIQSMGFENVKVVDQFEYKKTKAVIDGAMKEDGLSIVITTRPCALNYKIVEPHYVVDPDVCIGCRSCLKTNCPPIIMKHYEGHEKKKSYIDPDLCVGCSVCSQVCPVGAISQVKVVE